jgi:predicted alternative tryptophan synthase beta-subunit
MSLRRVVLDEREIPQVWYNLQADLPEPLPTMLHPVTRNPLVPDDLAPIFPPDLIEQELLGKGEQPGKGACIAGTNPKQTEKKGLCP